MGFLGHAEAAQDAGQLTQLRDRDSSPTQGWWKAHLPRSRSDRAQILNPAKSNLDADRYESAWNHGLQMTSAEALDYTVDNVDTASA